MFYPLGIVKINVLPFPISLSTQISPLCFFINSSHNINPSPVPVSFSVPAVDVFFSIKNKLLIFSFVIPTPVSATDILTKLLFSCFSDDIVILPFLFVNFIALLIKFLKIVASRFLSAKMILSFDIVFVIDIFLFFAFH